jgi:murein DD-endopeptidase MepM/ murein hydrolase activator NlpD
MRGIYLFLFVAIPVTIASMLVPPAHAQAAGDWDWPVTGPVIRGYDPPDDPYGSGHRGIDIAAAVGTPVRTAEAGTVTFAGKVGGELFATVGHGGGLATTYSWVSQLLVHKNDLVTRGQTIALSGVGHPGSTVAHLHFAVKREGLYVDPMAYLAPLSVAGMIRLAPLSFDG